MVLSHYKNIFNRFYDCCPQVYMRAGIVYYSRTGNTKKVAELISKQLKKEKIDVDLIKINHAKKPNFFKAGHAAIKQKDLPMTNTNFDLKKYDMLLVGAPIWAGKPAPFIKTFMNKVEGIEGKKAAVFLTCNSAPNKYVKAVEIISRDLENIGVKTIDEFLILKMKKNKITDIEQNIDNFVKKIIGK